MADTVEVVVKIPKLAYESIMNYNSIKDVGADYIREGTVLPKGHGDLVDRKEVLGYAYPNDTPLGFTMDVVNTDDINEIKAIIKADGEV